MVDELSGPADAIGAVNTIVVVGGRRGGGRRTGEEGARRHGDPAVVLRGENTDWLGMRNTLIRRGLRPYCPNPLTLASSMSSTTAANDEGKAPPLPVRVTAAAAAAAAPPVALVLGAGGTARAACYCVQQLGLRLVVFNRT